MTRREAMTAFGAAAAAGLTAHAWAQQQTGGQTTGDRRPDQSGGERHEHWDRCAETCSNCALACAQTANHCTGLAQNGKGEHAPMAAMLRQCADMCAGMSIQCAARSRMAQHLLEGCAAGCDMCAADCDKMGSPEMKRCAQACRDCAQSCREMVRAAR